MPIHFGYPGPCSHQERPCALADPTNELIEEPVPTKVAITYSIGWVLVHRAYHTPHKPNNARIPTFPTFSVAARLHKHSQRPLHCIGGIEQVIAVISCRGGRPCYRAARRADNTKTSCYQPTKRCDNTPPCDNTHDLR